MLAISSKEFHKIRAAFRDMLIGNRVKNFFLFLFRSDDFRSAKNLQMMGNRRLREFHLLDNITRIHSAFFAKQPQDFLTIFIMHRFEKFHPMLWATIHT